MERARVSPPPSRWSHVSRQRRPGRRMKYARRPFLRGVIAFGGASLLLTRNDAAYEKKPTRIILLGTKGGPTLSTRTNRSNPATLIVINDVPYLIDCGY